MMTVEQCCELSAQMESRAETTPSPALREEYLSMARTWDGLAIQAAWQDAWADFYSLNP
jgi:hypothetical protein